MKTWGVSLSKISLLVCPVNFPLAYFMTVYTDARTLELTLATIFRPHNSYCLHIDKKAEEEFKRTVLQIINCYRAKVELRVER